MTTNEGPTAVGAAAPRDEMRRAKRLLHEWGWIDITAKSDGHRIAATSDGPEPITALWCVSGLLAYADSNFNRPVSWCPEHNPAALAQPTPGAARLPEETT